MYRVRWPRALALHWEGPVLSEYAHEWEALEAAVRGHRGAAFGENDTRIEARMLGFQRREANQRLTPDEARRRTTWMVRGTPAEVALWKGAAAAAGLSFRNWALAWLLPAARTRRVRRAVPRHTFRQTSAKVRLRRGERAALAGAAHTLGLTLNTWAAGILNHEGWRAAGGGEKLNNRLRVFDRGWMGPLQRVLLTRGERRIVADALLAPAVPGGAVPIFGRGARMLAWRLSRVSRLAGDECAFAGDELRIVADALAGRSCPAGARALSLRFAALARAWPASVMRVG